MIRVILEEVEDRQDIAVQSSQSWRDLAAAGLDRADREAPQTGGVLGTASGMEAAAVFVPTPVREMMRGVLDASMPAVECQNSLRIGGAVGNLGTGLSGFLVDPAAVDHEGLSGTGECQQAVRSVVVQTARCSMRP